MKNPENIQNNPTAVAQVDGATTDRQSFAECAAPTNNAALTAPTLRLAYSVKEAAEILGVSEKSVRRLIVRGLLRPSRALRHLLIPRKEIERFLNDTTYQ